jgi:hypothetical protein
MLLRFEATNHRSILNPVELSMIAVDEDRDATRGFDKLSERVLTVAGIYGPNASGKSNVIDAVAWLSNAIAESLRGWDRRIPREPFRFGRGPESPSAFGIEMFVGGTRFAYQLEAEDTEITYEVLHSYPERRRRVLFERDGGELRFRRGLGGVSAVRELITPTTLALSAAIRLGEPEIEQFGRAVMAIDYLGPASWGSPMHPSPWETVTEKLFDAPPRSPTREPALALLRFADLGINEVQMTDALDPRLARKRVQLVHRAGGQDLAFDLREESAGTRMWFYLIGPVLNVLREGRVLLFDEIDASLHPKLSARLLELFQDPKTNRHGAQLLFTTHDTSLLNHLNRDEAWLTEKGDDGATTLTALAEFGSDKVRRSLNLEKAYLAGRFGAVPELDQFTLRRALGLAAGED